MWAGVVLGCGAAVAGAFLRQRQLARQMRALPDLELRQAYRWAVLEANPLLWPFVIGAIISEAQRRWPGDYSKRWGAGR
jgi:hypothetical protein